MFGLRSYCGVPVRFGDVVAGTVCALDEDVYDFESGDPSALELLRSVRDDIEADIASHFD